MIQSIVKAIRRFFGFKTEEEKVQLSLEQERLKALEKQAQELKKTFPKDIPNPLK